MSRMISPPRVQDIVFAPTAASVSQSMYTAISSGVVESVQVVFGVASVSGTLSIEKLTGTTAPGSGIALLTGAISLAGTANTVNSGSLTATAADLVLAAGDRIGLVLGGTLTSLVGGLVVVRLRF